MAGGVLIAAVSVWAAVTDLDSLVEPYKKASDEQAVGIVAAKAYVEPSRGGAEATPQDAVSLVLLPYSAAFEADLDAVKAGLRDSVDSYTRAVGTIEAARVDYEKGLVAAGAGELVRNEATDARGVAEVTGLPAGNWVLLAWREGGHQSKQHKLRDLDAKRYPDIPSTVTYSMVTYWRSRVTVRKGETVEVSLSDRNVWMTAPRQEGATPKPPRPPTPKKRR
ncbi:MAG TPA: hypothetical protein VIA61_02665 [Methylomirabilota bacterium]|jgi:hypothetical protein